MPTYKPVIRTALVTKENSYLHSHHLQSEHTTTLLSLTVQPPVSTLSTRDLSVLHADDTTLMTANIRQSREARGIYYRAKGPPICLPPWLASWLACWQCISTTTAVAAMALHNNCWLGSWSQLLALSQQPVCSTPLNYVHWRWCNVIGKLYSITVLPACQATITVKWVEVNRTKERMERWGKDGALEDMQDMGIWLFQAPWG